MLGIGSSRNLKHAAHRGATHCGCIALLAAAVFLTSPLLGQTTQVAGPAPQPAVKVVAVVNGEQISRQELANECLLRYGGDVAENVINKYLILQACRERGVVITEEDVDAEIERFAKSFGLPVDRWLELLETERNQNIARYRRDIIWPTLAMRRIAAKSIKVSQAELDRAFEMELGESVHVRMISVGNKQKAEQLRKKALANPDEFGALAKNFSEEPGSAAARGLIPPIRRHLGDKKLEDTAFSMNPGDISPVLFIANQYIILKCEKHAPATFIPAKHRQDAEDRLRSHIRDRKLRTAATELLQEMQEKAKVVNVYNDSELRRQSPGVAAMINGKRITVRQLAEECLARHGTDVLEGEINRKILIQELRRRRLKVVSQDVDNETLRAAETYGYLKKDGSADVEAWLLKITQKEGSTVELYIRDAVWPTVALKKLIGGDIQITEKDLQKGFEANFGERVEVLAIVLNDQRRAQKVWEMARANPTDQFFSQLAEQYSTEPSSRANSGHVPPIRKHGGQPLLEREAFQLKPGELSSIINMGKTSIIMRCIGRTEPVVKDFSVVRDEIYKDIHEKKTRIAMAKEFDRLKEAAQVDNFLEKTSQIGARPQTANPRR